MRKSQKNAKVATPSQLLNLIEEVLGSEGNSSGKSMTFGEWADGMLTVVGFVWRLKKVDAAAIRLARNIDLRLAEPEKNVLIERVSLADDLRARLGETGGAQVSLDELAAILHSLSPLMDTSADDQDVLRLCGKCIVAFTDAIKVAAGVKKLKGRPRRPKR